MRSKSDQAAGSRREGEKQLKPVYMLQVEEDLLTVWVGGVEKRKATRSGSRFCSKDWKDRVAIN